MVHRETQGDLAAIVSSLQTSRLQALSDTSPGTIGTFRALQGVTGCAGSQMKEVFAVLDPTTARTESLRNTDRWGYAGDYTEDAEPVEDAGGPSRWLVWVVLLAIAAIVIVALVGLPA